MLLPDVPVSAASLAASSAVNLSSDFATASVVTDFRSVAGGGACTSVTALVRVKYKDDSDDAPVTMPVDFVILVDVSGSMRGEKLDVARDALLKLSSMFNPCDRVTLVSFDDVATQLTALAPIAEADHEAAFRRQVMTLSDRGGTDVVVALRTAGQILAARTQGASASHVLLLTDGCDYSEDLRSEAPLAQLLPPGCVLSTLGFGADHDAQLLSSLSSHGKGSFSFVETSSDTLDETLSAYVGDSTRVLAPDVQLRVVTPDVNLCKVVRASAPGTVTTNVDGVDVELGAARVNGSREVVLELAVTPGTDAFDALRITLHASGTTAPPLVVTFRSTTPSLSVADADALAEACNRERLAVAAAAVAAASNEPSHPGVVARRLTSAGSPEDVRMTQSIVTAARAMLVGSAAARASALSGLAALEAAAGSASASRRAMELAAASRAQNSLFGSPSCVASKGASAGRYKMSCGKRAR